MLLNTGQDETINVLHQPFWQITNHCVLPLVPSNLVGWLNARSARGDFAMPSRAGEFFSRRSWSMHSDEWKQRKSVSSHSFIWQDPANNGTTWKVSCCAAVQISLFAVSHASSTLVFRDRLPHWLSVSSVGERLKRDGDRHSWDHVRRCHLVIFSVAKW